MMTIKPGAANKKPRPGRLRIVAGKWRSRLLDIADVPGLRPTSERVRAIFEIARLDSVFTITDDVESALGA